MSELWVALCELSGGKWQDIEHILWLYLASCTILSQQWWICISPVSYRSWPQQLFFIPLLPARWHQRRCFHCVSCDSINTTRAVAHFTNNFYPRNSNFIESCPCSNVNTDKWLLQQFTNQNVVIYFSGMELQWKGLCIWFELWRKTLFVKWTFYS